MTSKRSKIVFLFVSLCLAGAILFYFHTPTSDTAAVKEEISPRSYPGPRHKIEGFHYEGHQEGRKTASITADKFQVEKKKIGFLRFGLMNVAKLTNARVDIYGRRIQHGGSTRSETSPPPESAGPSVPPQEGFSFAGALSKKALPSFPVPKISSIVMEPAVVRLWDETSILTQISADSATIRLSRQDILFKKNVRVVCGDRVLTTDELNLLPEDALLRTAQDFVMKTPEKWFAGKGMTTDIRLVPR